MIKSIQLATAPCSWGVDFADRAENPDWRKVMDEAAAAGYGAIDLGPIGYFPTDPARLRDELDARGLTLSAGGLFDPLSDPQAIGGIIEKTRRTCKLLQALDAPRLVIIDQVSQERGSTAGRPTEARRLNREQWTNMMAGIRYVARVARDDYGVSSYLHAHAGCFIEFEDELNHAMNDLPPDLVGLCVDTGHSAYAGIDPVVLIRRFGPRIGHMHLKNIDPAVHAECIQEGVGFFSAIARNIFCPLGDGIVDLAEVRDALEVVGFSGLAVVEQDIDPLGDASPLESATSSFQYLRSINFGRQ
jgi:inosose dehydratase